MWSPHPGIVLPTTVVALILVLTDNWPTDDSMFVSYSRNAHSTRGSRSDLAIRRGRGSQPGSTALTPDRPWARRHTKAQLGPCRWSWQNSNLSLRAASVKVAMSESPISLLVTCGSQAPPLRVAVGVTLSCKLRAQCLRSCAHRICSRTWGRPMSLGYLVGSRDHLNYKVRNNRVRSSWPALSGW